MIPMKQTPLYQLAVVSAGQGAPKDNEFSESGVPFVRAGSLEALLSGKNESELELVSPETAKLRRLKIYPKGTILFAKSGMSATKDRVYVLQSPAHVVSHLATLIPKDGTHGDYLRLALKRFPPSSLIKDPAYPAIGLGEIENFGIPVPEDLDDQIRTAHLLGKVEGLIAQRKQHLRHLDDLLRSVFLEMFGDSDGWPLRSLSSIAADGKGTFSNGPFGSDLLTSELTDAGVPVIYIRDIRDARYERVSTVYVTEKKAQTLTACLVQPGDILVAKVGDPPGTTAVYPKGEPIGVVTQDVIRLRPNAEIVNSEFLASFLNSHIGRKLIRGITVEATRARFGLREFKMQEFQVPPMPLQIQFAAIVEKIEPLKSHYQQSLTDLEALYGALSQQAFKGELDLSRVALPAAPIEGECLVTPAVPAPTTTPVIELPESDLLPSALQDRAHLAPLLRFWLEAYCTLLGGVAFSLERFIAAAQARLAELHPDEDFELGGSDYEIIKAWVFEALATGALTQTFGDDGNRIELKAATEQGLA